jgi:endonuclease G
MMSVVDVIQETEARYAQHTDVREGRKAALANDSITGANDAEQLVSRAVHLNKGPVPPANLQERAIIDVPDALTFERIIGGNNLVSVNYLALAQRAVKAVGRILIQSGNGSLLGYGTGFMISPSLLLTNWHVLGTAADAHFSEIEFNFQEDVDRRLMASTRFALDPDTFFFSDRALDYCVVAVKRQSFDGTPLAEFGWLPLVAELGKVLIGEELNIIQHPGGERKQLALRDNLLVDILDNFLHYETDTSPGSSGSPVFNEQWEVVALHHSGVPRRDPQDRSKILLRNGQIWRSRADDDDIDWISNEGVRVSRIVTHLQQAVFTGIQANLRDQAIMGRDLESVLPKTLNPSASKETLPHHGHRVHESMSSQQDGTISLTIPITVTVKIGDVTPSMGSSPLSLPTFTTLLQPEAGTPVITANGFH